MKNLLILLSVMLSFFFLASPVITYAQENNVATDSTKSLFEKREFAYMGKTMPYRILYPQNFDSTKRYPLVLFLHDAGERGDDNEKQLTHGAGLFTSEESLTSYPAYVIFPQCPTDSFWAKINADRTQQPPKFEFDYNETATWPLMAANALVRQIIESGSVDTSRLYITGLSMGGMGTFETVYRLPGKFAAAMPICGGGSAKHYTRLVKPTAFWVFHGDADPVVNVKLSQEMVAKLKKLKADVKYTEYPGVDHNSWDNAFAEPEFLKWMFEQQLEIKE